MNETPEHMTGAQAVAKLLFGRGIRRVYGVIG